MSAQLEGGHFFTMRRHLVSSREWGSAYNCFQLQPVQGQITFFSQSSMSINFKILCHHVYEYHKGLRQLVLHTLPASELGEAALFLQDKGIAYWAQPVGPLKYNLYFGHPACVQIARSFGRVGLQELSDEEDFILGTMLGYDRLQQCQRYLSRKAKRLSNPRGSSSTPNCATRGLSPQNILKRVPEDAA